MMEKLDIIWRIVELLVAAVGASLITRFLTIRSRVKQEKAFAEKASEEARQASIDNVRKTMEEVYKPMLEDLRKAAADAMAEAAEARKRADEAMDKVEVLEQENRDLKRENAQLRDAIREISPDAIPSKRSENARRQSANQPRNSNGQFVKKED